MTQLSSVDFSDPFATDLVGRTVAKVKDARLERTFVCPALPGLIALPLVFMLFSPSLPGQEWRDSPDKSVHDKKWAMDQCERAVQIPLIQARLPGLVCVSEISPRYQRYYDGIPRPPGTSAYGVEIKGEQVTIRLRRADRNYAEEHWSTKFPPKVFFGSTGGGSQPLLPDSRSILRPFDSFVPADVSIEDLLAKLLRLDPFGPNDLNELCRSDLAEIRIAAATDLKDQTVLSQLMADEDGRVRTAVAANLTDQTALAALAMSDKEWEVRETSILRLTDQATLSKLAMSDKKLKDRKAAITALTDPLVLSKLAIEDSDKEIRLAAAAKIKDDASCAKVLGEARDYNVRNIIIQQVTDQAILGRAASLDPEPQNRRDAVKRLNDQALLSRLAIEDRDWQVRWLAVLKLLDPSILAKVAADDENASVRESAVGRLAAIRKQR